MKSLAYTHNKQLVYFPRQCSSCGVPIAQFESVRTTAPIRVEAILLFASKFRAHTTGAIPEKRKAVNHDFKQNRFGGTKSGHSFACTDIRGCGSADKMRMCVLVLRATNLEGTTTHTFVNVQVWRTASDTTTTIAVA